MSKPSFLFSAFLALMCIVVSACTQPLSSKSQLAKPSQKNTKIVAVWDLDDLSLDRHPYQGMGQLLSNEIIAEFSSNPDIKTVDRERLENILEELHLGSSQLAAEDTRLQLGRLAGANLMVFGAYQFVAGQCRLDLRLVDVETGKILKVATKTVTGGDLNQLTIAAKEAASELLR